MSNPNCTCKGVGCSQCDTTFRQQNDLTGVNAQQEALLRQQREAQQRREEEEQRQRQQQQR